MNAGKVEGSVVVTPVPASLGIKGKEEVWPF